jgi:hypothetical protein
MSLTLKFKTAQYRDSLNQFVTKLNADGVVLLKEEMRLLLRDILAFTPPTKSPKGDEVRYNARQRGATAIENDMARLATPMDWKNIEMPALAKAVHKRDIAAIKAITSHFKGGWKGRPILASLAEIQASHLRNRTRYGRIRGNKKQLAFLTDWNKYTGSLKKRVGWTRAGWMRAARAVGLPLPSWVTRHQAYAPSGYFAPTPTNLNIVAENGAIKIPNYYDRHVVPAIKARGASMASELSRLLKGGKSRRGSLAGTTTGQA